MNMDIKKELEREEARREIVDDIVWFTEWRDALEIDEPFSYENEESREAMREKILKRIEETNAHFVAPDYHLVTNQN